MDQKLYKVLKQLVKLGIITNSTRITKRTRRRRNKVSSAQVYRTGQPISSGTNTVIHAPTVQSEQAVLNLKASELQLQRALQNKDLPNETKSQVQLAINDIKDKLEEQRISNKNAYTYVDYKVYQHNNSDNSNYVVDEDEDPYTTKFDPQINPEQLKQLEEKQTYPTIESPTTPKPEVKKNYIYPEDDWTAFTPSIPKLNLPQSPLVDIGKIHFADEVDEPVFTTNPLAKPVKSVHVEDKPAPVVDEAEEEDEADETEIEPSKKTESIAILRKNRIKKLIEDYRYYGGKDKLYIKDGIKFVESATFVQHLFYLKNQYIQNGGKDPALLDKNFNNIPMLRKEIDKLITAKL